MRPTWYEYIPIHCQVPLLKLQKSTSTDCTTTHTATFMGSVTDQIRPQKTWFNLNQTREQDQLDRLSVNSNISLIRYTERHFLHTLWQILTVHSYITVQYVNQKLLRQTIARIFAGLLIPAVGNNPSFSITPVSATSRDLPPTFGSWCYLLLWCTSRSRAQLYPTSIHTYMYRIVHLRTPNPGYPLVQHAYIFSVQTLSLFDIKPQNVSTSRATETTSALQMLWWTLCCAPIRPEMNDYSYPITYLTFSETISPFFESY